MNLAVLHSPLDDTPIASASLDPRFSPARFLPDHHWTTVVVGKSTAVAQTRAVALGGYDAVVNMCDGGWDEDLPGPEVVATLERYRVAFTGAGSAFLDPTRDVMKLAAHAADVRVPGYAVLTGAHGDELDRALALRFPLIVKPPHGYSSVGIGPESKVCDADALRRQVAAVVAVHGEALVEEFVEGREVTVLVADGPDGPLVYPPVEFLFPEGSTFKHHALKWIDHAQMRAVPVRDDALCDELCSAARRVFATMNGDGYARLDLRLDRDGVPHFLEINPNCGVFYPEDEYGSADFILTLTPGGHRAFLEGLIDAAIRRRDRARRPWRLGWVRDLGFGLEAQRAIRSGAVIERLDGPPSEVVTLGQGARPDAWRPVRHDAAPNARLDGRDLVAVVDIPAGQPITLDHGALPGTVTVGPWPDAGQAPETSQPAASEARIRKVRGRRRS